MIFALLWAEASQKAEKTKGDKKKDGKKKDDKKKRVDGPAEDFQETGTAIEYFTEEGELGEVMKPYIVTELRGPKRLALSRTSVLAPDR